MSQPTETGGIARLVSGDVVNFHLVGVKTIRQVVAALREGRGFTGESLVLASGHRLVILQPGAIVQVDLLNKAAVDAWTVDFSNERISAVQITAESWGRAREFLDEQARRRDEGLGTPGRMITILGEWRLADRRKLYVRYELPTPRAVEQQDYLRSFFREPMIEIDGLNGELIFVNPRQVVSATYYPGALPHAETWMVQSFTLEP